MNLLNVLFIWINYTSASSNSTHCSIAFVKIIGRSWLCHRGVCFSLGLVAQYMNIVKTPFCFLSLEEDR